MAKGFTRDDVLHLTADGMRALAATHGVGIAFAMIDPASGKTIIGVENPANDELLDNMQQALHAELKKMQPYDMLSGRSVFDVIKDMERRQPAPDTQAEPGNGEEPAGRTGDDLGPNADGDSGGGDRPGS